MAQKNKQPGLDWRTAKKNLLRASWKLRIRYYLGKPFYYLETWVIRREVAKQEKLHPFLRDDDNQGFLGNGKSKGKK